MIASLLQSRRTITAYVVLSLLVVPVVSVLSTHNHVARADAPAGRYTAGLDTDGTTPIVTDNKTGLVWKKNQEPGGFYTWSEATTMCSGSWRVPTIRELLSVVDESKKVKPTIDTSFFNLLATEADYTWTSTPLAAATSQAWFVSFATGLPNDTAKTNKICRVRCVR